MALGGNTYDNNRQQPRKPAVNSPFSFANPMSLVDATKLSSSFWNRMLKLTITSRAVTTNEEEIVWDKEQSISVHLTHIKAALFSREIRKFMEDPITYNSSGVLSNETLVTISNGTEFGATGVFLVIRKINPETMDTVSSYSYEFNGKFHHTIRNYNEENSSFEKSFDDLAVFELEQLLVLLDNYVAAITNAVAYTVVDQLDYRMNRTDDMIKECASALGVSVKSGDGNNGAYSNRKVNKGNNSSFASGQPSGGGTKSVSLEDAEDDIFN